MDAFYMHPGFISNGLIFQHSLRILHSTLLGYHKISFSKFQDQTRAHLLLKSELLLKNHMKHI
jgi:hypothetical protein